MTHQSVERNYVIFTINSKEYTIGSDIPVGTSLSTFIRQFAHLKGTKTMCHEGDCGCCVVTVWDLDPVTKKSVPFAVVSCLFPVFSCDKLAITTIEGLGNNIDGYNILQARIAQFNATQCGFCTPGMVMNMFSLMEKKQVTMMEIENSLGGNICRCTGYRSILDAFKTLSTDITEDLEDKCVEIEELHKVPLCKGKKRCFGSCIETSREKVASTTLHIVAQGREWFCVKYITDIIEIFNKISNETYILITGNTAKAVYKIHKSPDYFINIREVDELKSHRVGKELVLGANMTLTDTMELFYSLAKKKAATFGYLKVLADGIDLIANIPIRNMGTLAGNLSIKHEHHDFVSDLFVLLETIGATLTIMDSAGIETKVSLIEYLELEMRKKVIKSIVLPSLDKSYHVGSYQVMPRAQNAYSTVSAGFLFKLKSQNSLELSLIGKPTIVFGGINPAFIHATRTEDYLSDKNVRDESIFKSALQILNDELMPDHVIPDASPEYRKGVAKALFYRYVLSLEPTNIMDRARSGGKLLERPLSSGKQGYYTERHDWPLSQPISKVEGVVQASGEAKFIGDIPYIYGELFAAFVCSTIAKGDIVSIDASAALKMKHVIAFYKAEDIPGKNTYTPNMGGMPEEEHIFCSGEVRFAGQAVGLIVAKYQEIALKAAQLVNVEYANVSKPLISIDDVLATDEVLRIDDMGGIDPNKDEEKSKAKHVIKGKLELGSQYHFTLETQCCVCVPIEDGMDVYPSCQWMDLIQVSISQAINIPENKINIYVKRVGGAFGSKISRSCHIATACALAAYKLNRPVRLVLSLEDNMKMIGKRFSTAIDYEVGVDENGVIKYLDATTYENAGCTFNESVCTLLLSHFVNDYDSSLWNIKAKSVLTDIPSNTYCRAPGTTEGTTFIENIMEHIAKTLDKDPVEVRINNLKEESPLKILIEDIQVISDYHNRVELVKQYNESHLWKKRGISLVAMEYPFSFWGNFHSIVTIYSVDGTVAVAHGGIECGQGINTKVKQVCAYALGIPLESVVVKPTNNLTAPNGMVTGGSIASEVCCFATMMCCRELLSRLEPVRKNYPEAPWVQLIAKAHKRNVDLCATYMFSRKDELKNYSIYGVTVCEVEIDVLTGQKQILRVDVIEDCGESMNPEIDIGQIEGALVMGFGYFLMEELVYDSDTGALLTNRSSNYKTPGAKDIPAYIHIQLRKNEAATTGILRSKAVGEPPFNMSCSALFAVRNALMAARKDAGVIENWLRLDAPATTEKIFLAGLANSDRFVL